MTNDTKPKVEGKQNRRFFGKPKPTATFTPPTKGLEDLIFDYNPSNKSNAGKLSTEIQRLAEYVSVNFSDGGPLLGQAVKTLEKPDLPEPADPVKDEDTGEVDSVVKRKWDRLY